jgi:8-amino-7-oxononanoate synthase
VNEAHLTSSQVPVLMGTLGKALGVAGAFVAGSAALIDGLVQFARPHIYSTALPPALAAAASAAIDIARFEDWRRDKLRRLVAHFRHGARERGIALLESRTPIQPVVIGASKPRWSRCSRSKAQGFFVPAIRPPTVAQGKGALARRALGAARGVRRRATAQRARARDRPRADGALNTCISTRSAAAPTWS